jgi:hypothetical protein
LKSLCKSSLHVPLGDRAGIIKTKFWQVTVAVAQWSHNLVMESVSF